MVMPQSALLAMLARPPEEHSQPHRTMPRLPRILQHGILPLPPKTRHQQPRTARATHNTVNTTQNTATASKNTAKATKNTAKATKNTATPTLSKRWTVHIATFFVEGRWP